MSCMTCPKCNRHANERYCYSCGAAMSSDEGFDFSGPIGFRSDEEAALTMAKWADAERRKAEWARNAVRIRLDMAREPLRQYELVDAAAKVRNALHLIRQAPGMESVRALLESANADLLEKSKTAKTASQEFKEMHESIRKDRAEKGETA